MSNRTITVKYTHATAKNRDKDATTKTKTIISLPKTYRQRTIPLSKRAFSQFEYFHKFNENHNEDDSPGVRHPGG